MVGTMGVISTPYYVLFLLYRVDQVKGVAGRLQVIEFVSVSDLASEVIVAAPQDRGNILHRLEV